MLLYGVKQLGTPNDEIRMYLDSYIKRNEKDLVELTQEAAYQIKKFNYRTKLLMI